jgi:hypothetical protein
MHLEELQDRPPVLWHLGNLEVVDVRRARSGSILTLGYEIFIHVDRIIDFMPPSVSSMEWLVCHSFHYRLGHRDDWTRAPPRARS